MEQAGIAGSALMGRAGVAALRALRRRWSAARELVILCGGGNNGGDGYVLAQRAAAAGLTVRIISCVPPAALRGDAAAAAAACEALELPIESLELDRLPQILAASDVVIDALLGIGLQQTVRTPLAAVIEQINACGRPVLSIDVPSGLCADTGRVQGIAVHANLTVTFIGHKIGLFMNAGPDHVGELELERLGLDGVADAVAHVLDATSLTRLLSPRLRTSHKGNGGHVVIVGGGLGMPGAARLAGEAALRVGAGRVSILCHPDSATAIASGRAELMVRGVAPDTDWAPLLQAADVRLVGPGLGRDSWAVEALRASVDFTAATVLDADALHLLSSVAAVPPDATLPWVLTPHPGEAAGLLSSVTAVVTAREIQADRLAALHALEQRIRAVVVLKGAGTLIGAAGRVPALCAAGNAALATAGTGDVLAGAIAGLWAQVAADAQLATPEVAWNSACAGVWLHASSADRWQQGMGGRVTRGLLAGELAASLAQDLP